MLADNQEELQELVDKVRSNSEVKGLRMNVKKTKTMLISRDQERDKRNGLRRSVNILVNGETLEQVDKFRYLGQRTTEDGRSDTEVKCRIEIARAAFVKMKDVFTSRFLSLGLRKRLVRCYVLSTFLYASESWTLNKDLEDRINALETWIYRRMLKISYLDKVTNEKIFQLVKEGRTLLTSIKIRKLQYFGHLVRADGFQKFLLEGKIEGVKRRGAQKLTWMANIVKWTGLSFIECLRLAQNRKEWRFLAANLRQSETELS